MFVGGNWSPTLVGFPAGASLLSELQIRVWKRQSSETASSKPPSTLTVDLFMDYIQSCSRNWSYPHETDQPDQAYQLPEGPCRRNRKEAGRTARAAGHHPKWSSQGGHTGHR